MPKVKLPGWVRGCLFDMDGVLTRTARVHSAAWKEMFDEFLRAQAERSNQVFVPFNQEVDYVQYVDGKKRADGTRSFLTSRGIVLSEGAPGDPPGAPTVHGLSNRKNALVLERLKRDGVDVFEGSLRFVRAARGAGLARAVVSASANAGQVLDAAGIADLFQVRIDGVVAEHEKLVGKPAPDMFLAGARALGVDPREAAVFEDALAGVEAGRAGKFGLVIGVNRGGQTSELRKHGADVVVADLAELLE